MNLAALAAALIAPLAAAQEQLVDFRYSAPIAADAGGSHYRFTLPTQAYRGAARRDLGDVRIFNASGEPVPYAFTRRELPRVPATLQTVRFFPLYGDAAKGLDATTVRVLRNTRGTVVNVAVNERSAPARRQLLGYLLDPGELESAKDALSLEWDAKDRFTAQARVEGSDDLKQWSTITANAPILSLQHAGASLERSRIELRGAGARYLRLSLAGVPDNFRLKEVRLELRPDVPQPTREWLTLPGTRAKADGEWIFDTAGHFPVDRVRLHLPQLNTVAQVQFQTRERVDDNWRYVTSSIVYRLAGEVTNPDIALPANIDRYWLLKVEQKGGGLGAGEVKLEIGWMAHEVIFAARGAPPFMLAYGNDKSKAGALAVSAVTPNDASVARPAKVGAIAGAAATPPSPFTEPVRFVRQLSQSRDVKRWALWAALIAGVVLLAWMALRLLRDVGKQS
jgi:hypothetical protein